MRQTITFDGRFTEDGQVKLYLVCDGYYRTFGMSAVKGTSDIIFASNFVFTIHATTDLPFAADRKLGTAVVRVVPLRANETRYLELREDSLPSGMTFLVEDKLDPPSIRLKTCEYCRDLHFLGCGPRCKKLGQPVAYNHTCADWIEK